VVRRRVGNVVETRPERGYAGVIECCKQPQIGVKTSKPVRFRPGPMNSARQEFSCRCSRVLDSGESWR
jgi:hypothetical protein